MAELTSGEHGLRRRRLCITPHLILHLLQGEPWIRDGRRLTFTGLPKNGRLVGAGFDHATQAFVVVLEDDTFSVVPFGTAIPQITVECKAERLLKG